MAFLRRFSEEWTALNTPDNRLVQIEYLRGIAALMVVFQHIIKERPGYFSPFGETEFGRAGVMIFFVISGFVMMHSCRGQSPKTFAFRRLARIVPLYWAMTLVFFLIVAREPLLARTLPPRLPELFQSLFFIPHYHPVEVDRIWPLLVPGWTLNYEMLFFVIFCIGLMTTSAGIVTTVILLVLVALGFVGQSEAAWFVTWTSPLLLLFLSGMGLAKIWQSALFRHLVFLFPVGWCLVFVGSTGLMPSSHQELALAVAAVITVAGALALQVRFADYRIRPLLLIGDASYSIYLSHTILMIFLYKGLGRVPLDGWLQFCFVTVTVATVCTLAGIALHLLFDRPVNHWLRARFEPAKTRRGAQAKEAATGIEASAAAGARPSGG